MKYFFALCGIVLSFCMIKFREGIGDAIGEQEWMRKVGGVYHVMVYIGVIIFFWSLATLTGTDDLFLKPLLYLVGIREQAPAPAPVEMF